MDYQGPEADFAPLWPMSRARFRLSVGCFMELQICSSFRTTAVFPLFPVKDRFAHTLLGNQRKIAPVGGCHEFGSLHPLVHRTGSFCPVLARYSNRGNSPCVGGKIPFRGRFLIFKKTLSLGIILCSVPPTVGHYGPLKS